MVDYIVTTRNADGALEERAYTAEDRADLFKKMAADGVTAVKVQEGVAGKKPRKAMKAAPSKYRGLVAATIVVLGAGAALFFLMLKSENSLEEKKDVKRQIKPAIADVAKTNLEVKAGVKEEQPKRYSKEGSVIPNLVQADDRGVYRWPNGARWVDPNRKVVKVERKTRLSTLFKHPCDRHIAAILESEPGQQFFGTVMYSKNLKEDFYASLEAPYEFNKDLSPEDRALQIAVADTKRELKKRVDAGEDLAEILTEARNELERLGAYRKDIEDIVKESINNEQVSNSDLEDVIVAANKMLEKEGLPAIKAPSIVMRQVILNRKKAKMEKQKGVSNE